MLPKTYNPSEHEEKIYRLWEDGGYFRPASGKRQPFCIIMPPPNANGDLHIGHALFIALEDIMTRYHRLKGDAALWLPGADHAGFETQVVYERKLEKGGRTRLEMSREEFYREVWEFTMKNKKNMEAQMRRLGASCDWSREKFTLDRDIVGVVYRTFKKLYDDGLVYRGERLVHYCTKHQTTFSDLEVIYEERADPLYFIRYPLAGGAGEIVVATVRPETMFGDTAVAVHPHDARYRGFIGKSLRLPLTERTIPIIAEEAVDPEFGTGAVKVTPAHDMTDWEIGQRHNLEILPVIRKDGKLNEHTPYPGLTIEEARRRTVEELKRQGFLVKIDAHYRHRVGVCYKCGTVIEPIILPQWFIKMKPLAEPAIEAVKKGTITIIPKHFERIYFHWLEHIRDWNISRQLWWGIPIPAYFCDECGRTVIDIERQPTACPSCGASKLRQDPDTFDTWFSSSQWPFATLQTSGPDDFRRFYPTSVMETGYEILFFWVARMVMLGLYMTGDVPFRTVYLHGTVRDKFKRKMSKSLGNVVNPMEVINLYGADALRMGLIVGNTPGTDLALDEEKIAGYRNFANKLWNISRFILMHVDAGVFRNDPAVLAHMITPRTDADRVILNEEKHIVAEVTGLMDEFRFYLAGEKLYHYTWHTLADKYIEAAKVQLADPKTKTNTEAMLAWLLGRLLIMLHPFMPFVTETIWQHLPHKTSAPLIIQQWPAP